MKIIEINSCNYGSTGKIMIQIAEKATQEGHNVVICWPAERSNRRDIRIENIVIGNRISRNLHLILAYFTGLNGCFSYLSTVNFLRKIKKIKPDIIHLHNLHNCYINLPLLFSFIKKNHVRIVWTLHDCWAFTGQCPHFNSISCEKWKIRCTNCPQYREYPKANIDQTSLLWSKKKKWFTGIDDLTLVTPSKWLKNLVEESYLNKYDIQVINNGIDLKAFNYMPNNLKKKLNIDNDCYVVLGVSFSWSEKKGLDIFVDLAKVLDDNYRIILIGTNDEIDKQIPANIISIHKTENQRELVEFYSIANVFLNPTREDNFPTVNMESLACGTPVITFNTGGSPEILDDTCGIVIEDENVNSIKKTIIHVCENNLFSREDCRKRALKYSSERMIKEYINVYEK